MKRLLYTFAVLMLGLMCSCSKDNVPEENSSIIRLMPIIGKDDVLTRASLFQNDDNLKSVSLHAYAYLAGNASFTANAGSDGINSVKGINVTGGTAKINAGEYALKSDANISVTGGKLILEGGIDKMYASGNANISNGTIQ
jgi:hypothetical protein